MYFGIQYWLCSRFAVVCHICIHRVSMTNGWYVCLPTVWFKIVMYDETEMLCTVQDTSKHLCIISMNGIGTYTYECIEFIANNVNVCIWKIYCVFTWIYTFRIDSGLMIYLDSFCSFLFWNIEMASCQEYSSSLSCFRQVFSSFQSVNVKSHQVFSTQESNHY